MFSKSLVAASAKPLILCILKREKSYGYAITQKVKELSGGAMEWSDGMLYPILKRLEKESLIQSEWVLSEEGRHRKYYSITEKGIKEIAVEREQWFRAHATMGKLWGLKPELNIS